MHRRGKPRCFEGLIFSRYDAYKHRGAARAADYTCATPAAIYAAGALLGLATYRLLRSPAWEEVGGGQREREGERSWYRYRMRRAEYQAPLLIYTLCKAAWAVLLSTLLLLLACFYVSLIISADCVICVLSFFQRDIYSGGMRAL